MTDYSGGAFLAIILAALLFGVGCYSYGYKRRDKGISQWSKKPLGKLAVCLILLLGAGIGEAGTRTVSRTAVTTHTDNTAIESANLPVSYEVWYVSPAGARTTITTNTTATSVTFNDAGMTKGATYNFYGKARTQDGSASADSSAYGWTVPFQVPKAPLGITIQ